MADASIKVSIEKVVHDAIRDTMQQIWDKHSILVDSVSLDWTNVSRVDKRGFIVDEVIIRTTTHGD